MGELNTIPMRINGVEGAAGQVKLSGGPGATETWGAPAPAVHVHAAGDVTSGQFPLTRMPRAAAGSFLEGNGVGADPIFNAIVEGNIPNHMSKNKIAFTLNKILVGAGAGANPTEQNVPTSTKELSVPVTWAHTSTMAYYNAYPGAHLAILGNAAFMYFTVPHDFTSLVSAVIRVIPRATQATANWNIASMYASLGELYNIHSEADAASTYNVVNNTIFDVNIAGILTNIVAGDNVGVSLTLSDATHDVFVLGIRFRYS